MAVIINEFEVIPASPQPAPPANNAGQGMPDDKADLSPQQIAQLLRKAHERALRLWAH